jgi:hypothetical protein
MKKFKFDEVIEINGQKLNKKYIAPLTKEQREELIDPIVEYLKFQGFAYPDDEKKIHKEWKRLLDFKPDLDKKELYNNSSVATYICKFFCKDFYKTKDKVGKKNMVDIFSDEKMLRKLVWNRLGLSWYDKYPLNEGCFNLTVKMFIQGVRSQRWVGMTSIFKPDIAKHIIMKYSEDNDVIYDPSSGWGGRMLGAAAVGNRTYIGIDPLTTTDLIRMRNFLDLKNCELFKTQSEIFTLPDNSVSFVFTSPPYLDQEVFSEDKSQAYMKGEDYFYDVYWKKTLENIDKMLKPGKLFALNVTNYPRMVSMAKDKFEQIDEIKLKLTRSHLNKKGKEDAIKFEPIYILRKNGT